jgi:hypothetical protein
MQQLECIQFASSCQFSLTHQLFHIQLLQMEVNRQSRLSSSKGWNLKIVGLAVATESVRNLFCSFPSTQIEVACGRVVERIFCLGEQTVKAGCKETMCHQFMLKKSRENSLKTQGSA